MSGVHKFREVSEGNYEVLVDAVSLSDYELFQLDIDALHQTLKKAQQEAGLVDVKLQMWADYDGECTFVMTGWRPATEDELLIIKQDIDKLSAKLRRERELHNKRAAQFKARGIRVGRYMEDEE